MNFHSLKHFLTNKKAQRWMFYEWFYSDLDWCLFTRENDFEQCLEHFFPEYQWNSLFQFTRKQFRLFRRKFGKPRRFSSAFLQSERKKLRKQRNLLRLVRYESSTHYPSEKIFLHHLPASIISSLKSGQSVLVRLHRSNEISLQRGKFLSIVENDSSKYRILFDDPTLGEIIVNDCDVMSEQALEMFVLAEKLQSMKYGDEQQQKFFLDEDDEEDFQWLSEHEQALTSKSDSTMKIPDRLLYLIIRISRILCAKRDAIDNLRQMNDQAIFERSERIPLSDAFRRNYAQLVQWLAKLNDYLSKYLDEINRICRDIVNDEQLLILFHDTKYICHRAQTSAEELVQRLNIPPLVQNPTNLQLITKLVALAVQMKEFSESEGSFLELHAIDEANRNFQRFLPPSLLTTYKRCVETSLTQFKSGLNQRPGLGPLQAFLQPRTDINHQTNHSSSMNQTFFSL